MELTSDAAPSVLQIASMFASLSGQKQHRSVAAVKANGGSGNGRGSGETCSKDNTRRAVNSNGAALTSTTTAATATAAENGLPLTDRPGNSNSVNGNARTRSRSSDSRPACLDLKVMDNKAKFDHVKALFENLERQSRMEQKQRTPHNNKKRVASPSPSREQADTSRDARTTIEPTSGAKRDVPDSSPSMEMRTTATSETRTVPAYNTSSPCPGTTPPPVPPRPKLADTASRTATSHCHRPCAPDLTQRKETAINEKSGKTGEHCADSGSAVAGGEKEKTARLDTSGKIPSAASGACPPSNGRPTVNGPVDPSVSVCITVNNQSSQSSEMVSPHKPCSLYEPYWRTQRYARQRLASEQDEPQSPPADSTDPPDSSNSNPTLKMGTRGDRWSPTSAKSAWEDNKDSGLGTDSPCTSTTDSRASSSINSCTTSTAASATPTKSNDQSTSVAYMTKEEASVLLSPSDVVLRDCADGRSNSNDGQVRRSLPSHLSIPQDTDFKRMSTCSMDGNLEKAYEQYSVPDDANVNVLPDGHFWIEVSGLSDEPPPSPSEKMHYKKPSKVKFSTAPIKVFSTYTGLEYDRRNEDVDPVSASAEYELERRLEKMELLDVELQKGPEGLGFSIIGMGVGADAGLEKLGIFVKSITPGGAVHKDGRIQVCDQIVEVDGKSLVGVSQNYAASVLRSTSGAVRFKIGREFDLDKSEIAALIRQSLEQDRALREQEELFQRRLAMVNEKTMEMRENNEKKSIEYYQCGWTGGGGQSDNDDVTPEQLMDANPHIERLMSQLRQPFDKSHTDRPNENGQELEMETMPAEISISKQDAETAFRTDSDPINSIDANDSTRITSGEFSRLLNDTAYADEAKNRLPPPNGTDAGPVFQTVEPCLPNWQNRQTAYGQLRRTTPDLTSSMDSMNGSEIQLCIDNLETELGEVRHQTDRYQTLLNDSKIQYDDLEKKYSRAKELIKDYQHREKDLLEREEAHLRQLREKDQQYANLVSILKEKVVELEKQLQEAHRKRASIVDQCGATTSASTKTHCQSQSDISPALAYQPAKKTDATGAKDIPTGSVRIVPIVRVPSLLRDVDDSKREKTKQHVPDFGVPSTQLLDNAAAKCKVEAVRQSQVMTARALPSRKPETEVFIMCHHTLENAHTLRAHASTGHCTAGAACNNCSGSAFIGPSSSGTNITTKRISPANSSSTSGTASPSTPRKLTAKAALLLRKKATVNGAACSSQENRHSDPSRAAACGNDLDKQPPVLMWTCDDVCRFLQSIGLEKYTPEFSINRVDGGKLLQLDGSRLKAMGVQNHSDRSLVKKRIKEMKAQIERERKQLEKESRRLPKLEKDKKQRWSKP